MEQDPLIYMMIRSSNIVADSQLGVNQPRCYCALYGGENGGDISPTKSKMMVLVRHGKKRGNMGVYIDDASDIFDYHRIHHALVVIANPTPHNHASGQTQLGENHII